MARDGFHVLDVHHHVGTLEALALTNAGPAGDGDAELRVRLASMDALGVDQAVVMPGHGYLRPEGVADTRRVNEAIAAYRDRAPDRFPAAVGIVEPLHGARGLDELDRLVELDLRGVSLHARFQGVSTNSPLVVDVVRQARQAGLMPFVHAVAEVPDEALWRVQELAEAVPDTTIVVLDALSSAEQGHCALRVATSTPNLIIDVSSCVWAPFIIELTQSIGAERVVFGTGTYSMSRPSLGDHVLDTITRSDLARDAVEAILTSNAGRLLGIDMA